MSLRWLIILLISSIAVCGCAIYQKPRPIHDVSFLEIDQFDWEQTVSNRIERLETDQEPDFDQQ